MKDEVSNSIKDLAIKAGEAKESADALRFSQAALNLQHVLQVESVIESAGK